MIRQLSRDTTLPTMENNHKGASNDHNSSNNNLADDRENCIPATTYIISDIKTSIYEHIDV